MVFQSAGRILLSYSIFSVSVLDLRKLILDILGVIINITIKIAARIA